MLFRHKFLLLTRGPIKAQPLQCFLSRNVIVQDKSIANLKNAERVKALPSCLVSDNFGQNSVEIHLYLDCAGYASITAVMTSFRYPQPPLKEYHRNYEAVDAIGNDRFILTQQNNLRNLSDGAFLVYDRCRNHWFGPIQMPVERNRQLTVWLLRFVDTHCFLFLLLVEPPTVLRDERTFDVILARLSTSLQEATIITRCRLQGPPSARYFPLLRTNLLLGTMHSEKLCYVYDISGTVPVVLDTFSLEHRVLYATQLRDFIFIVCKPIDSQGQVIMKSYNLDDRAISEVPNFDPRLSVDEDRRSFRDMNFLSAKNLLVTHLKRHRRAFYVFDLASLQPLFAVSTRIYHFYEMLESGEALLFNYTDDNENCALECKWFLPPKLAEIAMRIVHASMPSATKALLQTSNVDSPQALVRFLLEL